MWFQFVDSSHSCRRATTTRIAAGREDSDAFQYGAFLPFVGPGNACAHTHTLLLHTHSDAHHYGACHSFVGPGNACTRAHTLSLHTHSLARAHTQSHTHTQ